MNQTAAIFPSSKAQSGTMQSVGTNTNSKENVYRHKPEWQWYNIKGLKRGKSSMAGKYQSITRELVTWFSPVGQSLERSVHVTGVANVL